MVEVKVGDVFNMADAKSGASGRGPWVLFRKKAEQGSDQIGIWANGNNALDCKRWKTVKVKEITQVKRGSTQYNGQWYPKIDVSVVFAEGPATSLQDGNGDFIEIPPDNLDELPFN